MPPHKISYLARTIRYARIGLPYYGWRKTIKFCVAAWSRPSLYKAWLDYVDQHLIDIHSPQRIASLYPKLSLRYLRNYFSEAQKKQTLTYHYDLLESRFSKETLRALATASQTVLAKITGKSGRDYEALLRTIPTKEGELIISFFDTALEMDLAIIRGSFGTDDHGHPVFWLGVLQGPLPPLGREEVADATRDLFSLRPKQIVLYALCALCEWAEVKTIYAPSNAVHVASNRFRTFFNRQKIQASYESFWEEYTENTSPDKEWVLSLPIRRRRIEDVQAKRRKAWIQRYACLDNMAINIRDTMEQLEKHPSGSLEVKHSHHSR